VAGEAGANGDLAAEATALTWLGLAAWRLGEYEESRALGERALSIKLEADLRELQSRSYNALGLVAWQEARLTEAADLFTRAAEVAEEVGDAAGTARAAGNLALVATEHGEFGRARQGYTAMLRAGRAIGDPIMEGNALNNLGMLEVMVGQPLSAIPYLEDALALYRSADYPIGEENALGQLGSAYAALGDLGRAHAMYDSALAIARVQGLGPEEANDLEALAELYAATDNRVRALELYSAALEVYRNIGLEMDRGRSLRAQAEVVAELGNTNRALELATEALQTHERLGARFEEFDDLVVLTELHEADGSPGEADQLLLTARELAGDIGARSSYAAVALVEARIADSRAEPERVLAALGEAGPQLFRGDYETEWEAHALRARAFLRLGAIDSALIAGRRAVKTVERVRGSFRSRAMRTGFSAARQQTYADLVSALLASNRIAGAFEVADRARGQALREHLVVRDEVAPSEAGRAEARRAEELLRQIGQLVATLDALQLEADATADVDGLVGQLWSRLAQTRSEYENLQVSLAEGGGRLRPTSGPANLASTQRALEPGEILLEYFIMPARVLTFLVSRDSVMVLESETPTEDLESRVRLVRKLVASPGEGTDEAAPVFEALFEALIAPAARAAPIFEAETLILVPHGVLTYLPFSALLDPESGRRLVELVSLVHLPSAGSLTALRSDKRPRKGLVADAAQVLVPFPSQLPATDEEGLAVESQRGALLYRGATATEARLREALEEGGVVHVASHASMNARNPIFSRVELAPGSSGEPADDGRLETYEILELAVRAPLVYLSGCETALGPATATRFDRGEDYSTLAQSLLYAGAENVLATLWRVEDRSAAVLAGYFYEELEEVALPKALARAQRRMIAHPEFGAPFYWAGYRLNGARY
jgi:CHAT domain-containing protein/tetratricopeptide (TPR) repeat protein